jgi:hypothetical protein
MLAVDSLNGELDPEIKIIMIFRNVGNYMKLQKTSTVNFVLSLEVTYEQNGCGAIMFANKISGLQTMLVKSFICPTNAHKLL